MKDFTGRDELLSQSPGVSGEMWLYSLFPLSECEVQGQCCLTAGMLLLFTNQGLYFLYAIRTNLKGLCLFWSLPLS